MKNPLVVGYRGEIGSYILKGLIDFLPSAIPIMCVDVHDKKEQVRQRILEADVIFLCINLKNTPDWIDELCVELKDKVVIEQTSLKSTIFSIEYMNKLITKYNIQMHSMHILFRPSITDNIKDRVILLLGDKEFWCTRDLTYFFNKGLDVDHFAYIDAWQNHDEEMARQQALVHRVILTLGEVVSEGLHYEKNTYVSREVLRLAQRIKSGDAELYALIKSNPGLPDLLKDFSSKLQTFDIKKHMK